MRAEDLINLKSEILEPLHNVAEEVSELDARKKSHLIEYTDLDVIAAAVVFTHIMANRKAHQYVRIAGPKDLDRVADEMSAYGKRIKDIVNEMSNVDLDRGEQNGQKGNSEKR